MKVSHQFGDRVNRLSETTAGFLNQLLANDWHLTLDTGIFIAEKFTTVNGSNDAQRTD